MTHKKHIIGKSLPKTVQEEYQLAKKQHRQALCVYCGEPLEVIQIQSDYVHWYWDEIIHSYKQYEDKKRESEPPYCLNCSRQDWDFIDYDLVTV